MTLGAAALRGGGDRDAHLAGAAVADEPRRIDRLVGRPGGDDDALAGEILRRQHVRRGLDDVGRLGEPPRAGPPAREEAVAGSDHAIARDVDEPRTFAWVSGWLHMLTFIDGASSTGARVASTIAVTASSACPAASRASVFAVAGAITTRSALIGELDVADRRLLGEAEQIGEHRAPGQRLERHRRRRTSARARSSRRRPARRPCRTAAPARRPCTRRSRRRPRRRCGRPASGCAGSRGGRSLRGPSATTTA